MQYLVAFLVFTFVVVIHEWGHFIMARKNGIFVEEFAIGMGPAIFKKQGKETLYSFRILPIGGYCKMLGENDSSEDERAFVNKSVVARMKVIVGGVTVNFIFAFIVFWLLNLNNGIIVPVIEELEPGFPGVEAGLQVGDKITKINNRNINIYYDVIYELGQDTDQNVDIEVERNGEALKFNIDLKEDNGRYKIGFSSPYKASFFDKEATNKVTIFEAFKETYFTMIFYVDVTVSSLVRLVTGALGMDNLMGPVGLVNAIGDDYTESVSYGFKVVFVRMISFAAEISLAVGIFNLLPFPALDGGRLVFLFVELLRGKPIPVEKEGYVHLIGFALLILLAVFVAYSDIAKLIS